MAEKAKDKPDPGWLQAGIPGLVRVSGTIIVPYVYQDIILKYRIDKSANGLKLTLVNPDELKAARREPADFAGASDGTDNWQWYLWIALATAALLLLGVALYWRQIRQRSARTAPPA